MKVPVDARELYLGLLKSCLTRSIFPEADRFERFSPYGVTRTGFRAAIVGAIGRMLSNHAIELTELLEPIAHYRPDEVVPPDGLDLSHLRREGRLHSQFADTMIGMIRLNNVHECIRRIVHEDIPGDVIETGVWRGGTAIFMRGALEAYGDTARRVWVADSFEGLPKPNTERYPQDAGLDLWQVPYLAVSLDQVKANFERFGLLDDRVRFLKGWFKDTLPEAPIDRLAMIRLDGDMYESTMNSLQALYPKLSPGGFLIVDDYLSIEACRSAVTDYRTINSITEDIVPVDWSGVFWQRRG